MSHHQPPQLQACQTTLFRVNLKFKLPPKFQKYASLGVIPKILLLPFALLAVFLMRLIRPLLLIQICEVYKHRIGHFAIETELIRLNTKKRQQSGQRVLTVYYFPDKHPANKQLEVMWRRELPTVHRSWGWLLNKLTKKSRTFNITSQRTQIDRDGLLTEFAPLLKFTSEELNRSEIARLNLTSGEKFICLHVRDTAYYSNSFGYTNHQLFRNTDIQTYVQASEALAEMGYTVFRMGAIVKEPLVSKHPKVIDYATNGMRTDFLDIYLGAHCAFTITTSSGWDSIPTIFRRPCMKLNVLPVCQPELFLFPYIFLPKLIVDAETESYLSLNQIFDHGISKLYDINLYSEAGVKIQDLSSEELVEAVTEMVQRFEGTFVETPEQKEMQAKLKHILSTHPKLQPSPNYYPIRAQFASCFLSRYPNFLD